MLDTILGEATVNEFLIELKSGLGKFGVEMLALEFISVRVEDRLSMSNEV